MGAHTGPTTADITAWVSACAAVVQAIGAILAIFYSVKLARDAAKREIAADEANARRIIEADAAAEERRRADRVEVARAAELAEIRAFNHPLDLALGMASLALEEVEARQQDTISKGAKGDRELYWISPGQAQDLLIHRLPDLIAEAVNVEIATALRTTLNAFSPFNTIAGDAPQWMRAFNDKLPRMRESIENLRALKR
jgi:hypothetical protein